MSIICHDLKNKKTIVLKAGDKNQVGLIG